MLRESQAGTQNFSAVFVCTKKNSQKFEQEFQVVGNSQTMMAKMVYKLGA